MVRAVQLPAWWTTEPSWEPAAPPTKNVAMKALLGRVRASGAELVDGALAEDEGGVHGHVDQCDAVSAEAREHEGQGGDQEGGTGHGAYDAPAGASIRAVRRCGRGGS
ncbi:hypothetical protein ABT126_35495 [Streptomyces sp. NPDC002012]|uniref:hypothetical protein n=1 Tax=unclassified Streptomyces TaxID=2593676 RepID=UPI00332EAB46